MIERDVVTRELHDGPIQSLITIDMRLSALTRRPLTDPVLLGELADLQTVARDTVRWLRDFTQRIKPIAIAPDNLLRHLITHIRKFEFDTGIRVHFVCEVERVALPQAASTALARLVQEALVNVRKHSGASQVTVRLSCAANRWSIVVEDDGKGFAEPVGHTAQQVRPAAICDCVRDLGGTLTLGTAAAGGARLEATFPTVAALQQKPSAADSKRRPMAKARSARPMDPTAGVR